ncbi:MAG: tRNA pseudouridine(55) synthase TruB [Chloroflexi bacterium]|nr:tRNA pseudouridine(55) synthase TruB [Chloroflexota bacterium]
MSAPVDVPSGFLVTAKPIGARSTALVQAARGCLGRRKVGHCGTLDPLAAGVLPLAIGHATRLSEYVLRAPKTYIAAVVFGVQTTTDDLEGAVMGSLRSSPEPAEVLGVLPKFVGTLCQRPPAASAVQVDGRRAYARSRAGEDFTLPEREVEVHAIAAVAQAMVTLAVCDDRLLLDGNGPGQPALVVALEVRCGRGTFIRSLARDIGETLGCGASLLALVRTAVGPFTLADAIGLAALRRASPAEVAELVHAPDAVLDEVPACLLAAEDRGDFVNGRRLRFRAAQSGLHRFYDADGAFLGVAEHAGGEWRKLRVMQAAA